ncbi:MAG: glycosyltransferase family 2 protein [Rhodoferax sp.]
MSNRISVIIQSHNRSEGLKRALFSLQMQTFKDFEVVISDDSDDKHQILDVLNGPAGKGLDIHFRHTEPCGAAQSMREAFDRTRFEYIKILHDDDWLTPRSFECQMSALNGNQDTNAVYGRAMICYPNEDKIFFTFAEGAVKIPSSQWVSKYEVNGIGPVQSPVTALYRRHQRFRVMWDEFINPNLREAARKTGAGTDVSLQVGACQEFCV